MASSSQHRCVFVGNIPYDATEEQLIDICREVGPVVSFRLVIDRETGKPKGYGFCEYKDEETALSARRNLQGYEINGRQLRVDFAENDKNADKNREQGRGGPGLVTTVEPLKQVGGPAVLGEYAQHQPIGLHVAITAATVMAGALGSAQTGVHSNQNSLHSQSALASDPLTLHLAKMSRSQLYDVISEMKAMATQNKELARQLLLARSQLPKALFQAQIMLGLVNAQVLHMPNIRQPPGPNTMQDTQQAQQPAIQTLPGLPPLAQRNHPGLVPKMHEGQFSSATQSSLVQNQTSIAPQPMQPRSQVPQLTISHVPQPAIPPGQSGVPSLRPSQPSVRPQAQGGNTSSLNQQIPTSLLQHSGQVAASNSRHTSQVVLPNATMKSSVLPRPPLSDATFQPGPKKPGISDAIGSDADRSVQAKVDTAQVYRSNAYLNMQTNKIEDPIEPVIRPSKLLKLDDGRSMHFSSGASNVSSAAVSRPSQASAASSAPKRPLPKAEESKHSEKQVPQLPTDVESALLQQVLNLTPEQLNSLPAEQRQQVIQLQQALRRDQIQQPS
ncbi:cleavage stimulating factor 64 [Euphorbia lathyris]|uniref:cleavage stimulating factor 64 n=1 Tax=Euphorbia lathyris TaxID=212925 RepID=UPI0033133C50